MRGPRRSTLERSEKIVGVLRGLEGKGISVHGLSKAIKTDAANVKRAIDAYCATDAGALIVERYLMGTYSYYRLRVPNKAQLREADLFRGWGGAPRLGLGK